MSKVMQPLNAISLDTYQGAGSLIAGTTFFPRTWPGAWLTLCRAWSDSGRPAMRMMLSPSKVMGCHNHPHRPGWLNGQGEFHFSVHVAISLGQLTLSSHSCDDSGEFVYSPLLLDCFHDEPC